MKNLHRWVLVAACALVALAGCSSNPTAQEQRRDRLGVQVATMALIERADDPQAKAASVIEAVAKARVLLDFAGDVSVTDLRQALLERVAERYEAGKLSPLERLAALEAIQSVSDEVEARLGVGALPPDARVKVDTVLTWVEDAARSYVPHNRDS